MNTQETALTGSTLQFISPSKLTVVIREQNGEDEETISRKDNIKSGNSIVYYLAGIILTIDGKKVSSKDIENLRVTDKYYILLKSRIFSLGAELNYKHRCSNDNCTKPESKEDPTYEEDLSLYDRDFNEGAVDDRPEFKHRVKPITLEGTSREFTLSSGKRLRYKFLTSVEEKKTLEWDKNSTSKNSDILVREIEWEQPLDETHKRWVKLQNFKIFSSREMAEIRSDILKYDLPFEAISECKCPYCSSVDSISLLTEPNFFYPGEIQ